MAQSFTTKPAQKISCTIQMPPDKSILHRALILGALSKGLIIRFFFEGKENITSGGMASYYSERAAVRRSERTCERSSEENSEPMTGPVNSVSIDFEKNVGQDIFRTFKILQNLGVRFERKENDLLIYGKGLVGLQEPKNILDCGNSGTTMRLMLGVLCGLNLPATLTGDASLSRRPMDRVIQPLTEMGGRFEVFEEKDRRFIRVLKQGGLKSISYDMPIASAQVKSALLLAGFCAGVEVKITEPYPTRDHTERLLNLISPLSPFNLRIPGDFSSAAFFITAGLLCPDSELVIQGVGLNPTRTGFLKVLQKMGADIVIDFSENAESYGDLYIRSAKLRNITITADLIHELIDEIPLLALVAAFADGDFEISGAQELRVKECDRLKAICTELQKLGIAITEKPDGFKIFNQKRGPLKNKNVSSWGDHRIAMMLAIAGLVVKEPFVIDDVSCVATSFPGFFNELEKIS